MELIRDFKREIKLNRLEIDLYIYDIAHLILCVYCRLNFIYNTRMTFNISRRWDLTSTFNV